MRRNARKGERFIKFLNVRVVVFICRVLNKSRRAFKPNRRKRESPLQVPESPSTFPPHAQYSASRRHDARLQSRTFARWNQSLRHSYAPTAANGPENLQAIRLPLQSNG